MASSIPLYCWVLCRSVSHRQIHRRGRFWLHCWGIHEHWLLRDFSSAPQLFDFPQTHRCHIPGSDVISFSAVDDGNIFNPWGSSCFLGCLCTYPPQFQYHLILFFVSQSVILFFSVLLLSFVYAPPFPFLFCLFHYLNFLQIYFDSFQNIIRSRYSDGNLLHWFDIS